MSTEAIDLQQQSHVLRHTAILTLRQLRGFGRMPVYLLMNLIQPMIWLFLFGQLFKSVVTIPGFEAQGNYLEFLTPGIVMMMALFGAAWTGTTFIQDMERGVMDRFLTSPTSRSALMVSSLLHQAVLTIIQTSIVLGVAWLAGARFDGGFVGMLVLMLSAVLLTFIFGAFSNAVALLARQQEALIGISQLLAFPIMFLSSGIMDTNLAPQWVQNVARYNPFEWAVTAGREALDGKVGDVSVWSSLGLLTVLVVVLTWLATRAFRSYQRST